MWIRAEIFFFFFYARALYTRNNISLNSSDNAFLRCGGDIPGFFRADQPIVNQRIFPSTRPRNPLSLSLPPSKSEIKFYSISKPNLRGPNSAVGTRITSYSNVPSVAIARRISMHLVNKIESRRSEQLVIMQLVFCIERYVRYFFLFCQHHRETLALLCNFAKWDVRLALTEYYPIVPSHRLGSVPSCNQFGLQY